jgi:hypothetical protein
MKILYPTPSAARRAHLLPAPARLGLVPPLGQIDFVSIVLGPDIFQHKALLGR